jgi:hypothetical protein
VSKDNPGPQDVFGLPRKSSFEILTPSVTQGGQDLQNFHLLKNTKHIVVDAQQELPYSKRLGSKRLGSDDDDVGCIQVLEQS